MNDWRYSEEKMQIRQNAYIILLSRFGSKLNEIGLPIHNMKDITECAHDWVSQGNMQTDGIVSYFNTHYA